MSTPSPSIICVGHAALDRVFGVESWPATSAKIVARTFDEAGGGMAANAAVAVTRLGGHAQFWGPVGADTTADTIEEQLREEDVNVGNLRRFRDLTTSTSAVLVDARGERLVVGYRGTALTAPADWLRLELVAVADAVLADVRWPQGAALMLHAARVAGLPAILDADVADREVLVQLAASADHVLYSERGAKVLGGDDIDTTLRTTIEAGAKVAAVTLGERGVAWIEAGAPEGVRRLPAFPIRAIDTLAAGDVFHGAYAVAVARGLGVTDAICFASAAAAIKCTRRGGRNGAPQWNEVMAFLETVGGTADARA